MLLRLTYKIDSLILLCVSPKVELLAQLQSLQSKGLVIIKGQLQWKGRPRKVLPI